MPLQIRDIRDTLETPQFSCFFMVQLLDAATTLQFLKLSGNESNPMIAAFMKLSPHDPFVGLLISKLLLLATVVVYGYRRGYEPAARLCGTVARVFLVVVIWNSVIGLVLSFFHHP